MMNPGTDDGRCKRAVKSVSENRRIGQCVWSRADAGRVAASFAGSSQGGC